MFRLYLLTIISSITANHIGTSTISNLSIIKSGNSYYCTITNDTLGSALSWDYQNTEDIASSNVYCNVEENNKCKLKSLNNRNWQWIADKNVSPILDYRWESFDVLKLENSPQKVYETNEENFRISFSVKITEVHILLCDRDIPYSRVSYSKEYGNCYWISLGAYSGKESYIRKCVAGAIPYDVTYPRYKSCAYKQTNFTGVVTNETQWNHFTVSKQENTISVWNYGRSEPILKYTDRSQEVFTTKYVFARRPFSDHAYFMKIHEVKIFPINESSAAVTIQLTDRYTVETNCLALYVKSCKGCSFNLNLSSKYEVIKQVTIKSLGDDWQEVLLQAENNFTEAKEISLRTYSEIQDNTEKPYWHISNTIRKCGSTDFAMKKGDSDGCCYALKYPDQQICTARIKDTPNEGDWTCPANTIGKSCIPCTSIPGEQKCEYSKLCEWTSNRSICSCAPGYYNMNCQSECLSGRYGLNCKMECGRCVGTCNNIDGTCSSCERNFEGDTCRMAILPLLKNAPKINKIGHTNVTILADMEYEGKQEPLLYEILLYQENDGIWIRHGKLMVYSKSSQSYVVNNLRPSTKYKIKILLQTSNVLRYDGTAVPEAEFETTCADITEDILQMKVTNTSITLTVDVNKPRYNETCLISQYRLFVYDIGKVYSLYNKQLQIENSIESLKPYTNYKIQIRKNNVVILNATLQTKQGAPGQVQNVFQVSSTNTTVAIRWDNPLIKNGYITGYRIQYQHFRYRMCATKVYSNSRATTISTINTTAIVSNLLPFSNYFFKIWAVTEYDGEPKDFAVQTEETSSPSEDEFPNFTFTESNKELNVMMTWNCEKLKGPLRFRAELTCKSEWCSNRTQNDYGGNLSKDGGNSKPKMQFQTTGKTEYVLKFFISRNNHEIFSLTPLTTGPSVPGFVRNVTVYSRNSTSATIRWLPPYPPEGDVESYWVSYSVYSYRKPSVEMKIEKTAFCKLWPEYICVTITELEEHSWYYFHIEAKNMDVSEKGRAVKAPAYTQEEAPDPPQNMGLQWDNQYGLIVRWQHPDITNGVLREFLLYINDENMASYPVTEEYPQYQYKMNISEELTLQELKIGIAARNSAGHSMIITNSIFSPPKTPKFVGNPYIDDIKKTSFSINIPKISNIEGESSYMYIILTDDRNPVSRDYLHPAEQRLFEEINVDADFSWTAGEFDLTDEKSRSGSVFEVGDGTETTSDVDDAWELRNRKLIPENTYQVVVILKNTFRDLIRYKTYSFNSIKLLPDSTKLEYLYVLLVVPVLVCIIVFLVKKKCIKMGYICNFTTPRTESSRNLHEVPLRSLTASNEILSENMEHSGEINIKSSQPVRIADLNIYLKNALKDETLVKQYKLICQYETKSPIEGAKIKNKLRKDFNNSTYDHTKVKLRNPNRKRFTNYINANYIDGYDSKKTFIATVIPKVGSSTNQFWQMICQENVEYIILLTNIVQPGKSKFEKYWPDLKDPRDFGNTTVELDKVETNANYEVRYFSVFGNRKMRKVQQFCYLTWPDCGVPSHARKLVPFLKKVLGLPQGRSPIVVHCSADVDYTGSVILCNICLRMAAHEGKMDVVSYLSKIRQQRGNMVADIEQYKLVYLALLQCVSIQNTGILYDESMEEKIDIQMNEKIEEEMKYLADHAWEDEMELTSNPSVANKSSSPSKSSTDRSSERINAVAVDSFTTQGKFVVTQNPNSDVVGEFWELVAEKQITTIICLNSQNKGSGSSFFPRSTDYPLIPTPQVEVKYVAKDVKTHYVVYILLITRQDGNRESNTQTKILWVKNWSSDMLCPQGPINLLTTYEEMNRLGRPDTILITCHDGVRASGLFVAMCFVIDKLKANQLCDVSLAVRTVRRSRREFVRDKEQFSFLYQCVLDYVREFGLYSTPNI